MSNKVNNNLHFSSDPRSSYIDRSEHYATSAHAIVVENITVAYRSYEKKPTSIKEAIIRYAKDRTHKYYSTFDALSSVSFSIPKGQVIGFIGSNGAGKSTLLKVLIGVLPPTQGKVKVSGKVDSLIQLGAGFDTELSAIENIYLNGSLRGKTKQQIAQRVPRILEFAELEDFGTTPIKYFSAGMYARLGFSVAIDDDPDILIVDEVLAVGDERFSKKCHDFFHDFVNRGKTLIIVSHALEMLQSFANQVGLLSKGDLVYLGDPKQAIELYRSNDYQTRLESTS